LTKLTLSRKLVFTCLALVIVPVILMGLMGLWSLLQFSRQAVDTSGSALEKEALSSLEAGCRSDLDLVQSYVTTIENDSHKLSFSGNLQSYEQALLGLNKAWNQFAENEAKRILEGLIHTCATQQKLLEKTTINNLAVAERLMKDLGPVSLSPTTDTWEAVNQFSQEKQTVALPTLQLGSMTLQKNKDFNKPTPLVDEVSKLVGGACTIFQRMNEKGDMLHVATDVKLANANRAIGTFIPAVQPGGKENAVIAAILKGGRYHGRAFVVNAWYVTAYQPILDGNGSIIGMLFTGNKEQENDDLIQTIVKTKIGETGYPFVMDSQGVLLLHPRKELVGKNTISDLQLPFQEILDKKNSSAQMLNYDFEGRRKFIAYSYFPAWDWTLCVSGYWDELSRAATQSAKSLLTEEMVNLYKISQVKDKPMYPQLRLLDAQGNEVIVIKNGVQESQLGSRAQADWFIEACKKPAGQSFITPVELAANTGEPEIRVAAPVYIENKLRGMVVLNADWQLTRDLLADRVYGQTGYPYVLNDRGVLITHPKYTLKDQVNIGDASYGELADIVNERMNKGEGGTGRYSFEGIDKFVTYQPLKLGDASYTVAATFPRDEMMMITRAIETQAKEDARSASGWMTGALIALSLVGGAVGFLISAGIAKPLRRITLALKEASTQTSSASSQVAQSSQDMAQGASEQASSLQETSSALEEMSSMTRQNADNSGQANHLMQQAQVMVGNGVEAMNRMAQTIQEISRSSTETAKIVKTIDEIAFQTNLLALNAAVEAARAGEAGKGFAVVAEEVRNLARRSAEAAKNTTDLIDQSRKNAEAGVKVSAEVAGHLTGIKENTGKVAMLIAEITAASKEQAQGIEQVNTSVSEMDKVVQQNAAHAEESASAAEELSSQSHQLMGLVSELTNMVESEQQQGQTALPGEIMDSRAPKRIAASRSPRQLPGTTRGSK